MRGIGSLELALEKQFAIFNITGSGMPDCFRGYVGA